MDFDARVKAIVLTTLAPFLYAGPSGTRSLTAGEIETMVNDLSTTVIAQILEANVKIDQLLECCDKVKKDYLTGDQVNGLVNDLAQVVTNGIADLQGQVDELSPLTGDVADLASTVNTLQAGYSALAPLSGQVNALAASTAALERCCDLAKKTRAQAILTRGLVQGAY